MARELWRMVQHLATLRIVRTAIFAAVFTVDWQVDQLVPVSTASADEGEIGFSFSQLQDRPLPRAALLPWGTPSPSLPAELPDFERGGGGTLGPSGEDSYLAWRLATVIVRTKDGWGSGAFVSPDGWLLTNYHVVESSAQLAAIKGEAAIVEVVTAYSEDGRLKPRPAVRARVYRVDPIHDLALVKVEALPQGLKEVPFFRLAAAVRQGEDCVVIGSQRGGLSWWARAGNVSALFDFPDEMTDTVVGTATAGDLLERTNATVVITDTRISGGDSGGPLLNAKGELIGLTFATPTNRVAGSVGWHIALKHLHSILLEFPSLPEAVPFDFWTAGMTQTSLGPPQLIDADQDGLAETVVMVHAGQVQDKDGKEKAAMVAVSIYMNLSHKNEKKVGEAVELVERTPIGLWGRPDRGSFHYDLALSFRIDEAIVAAYPNRHGIVDDLRLGTEKEKGASIVWQMTDKRKWRAAQPMTVVPILDSARLSEAKLHRVAAIVTKVMNDLTGTKETKQTAPLPPPRGAVAPWPAKPLIDGNWEEVSPEEFVGVLQKLGNPLGNLKTDERRLFQAITRLRALPLPCYKEVYLLEGETRDSEGRGGVLSFLVHARGVTILTGDASVIHEFNQWSIPQLQSSEQALAYMTFFAGAIIANEGNFRILQSPGAITWRTEADRTAHAELERQIQPLKLSVVGDKWVGQGTMQYLNGLFRVRLSLPANGRVNMMDDSPFGVDLPIRVTRYSGLLRYDSF